MRQKTIIAKLLQSVTEVYCKVRQVLQSVTDCYYKVRQVLQSATVITKWDVTTAGPLLFLLQTNELCVFKVNHQQFCKRY